MKRTPAQTPRRGALICVLAVAVLVPALGWTGPGALAAEPATTTTTAAPPADPTTAPTDPPPTAAPPVTTPLTDQTPVVVEPPQPDPTPHIRVLLARIQVSGAEHDEALLRLGAMGAHQARDEAAAAVAVAEQARVDADAGLQAARQQLSTLAAYAYMHAGGGEFRAVLAGDSTAKGRERELFAISIDHHDAQVVDAHSRLTEAEQALESAREALDAADHAAADADAQLAAAGTALDDDRHELDTATADEGRPPTRDPWTFTIEGVSTFTPEELAQWYEEGAHGSQASVPMADIARSFVELGDAEGIRGDMAFAQSIHETGWFANTDTVEKNNFAGIGHCSDCGGGFPFDDAATGVLAQIQLLKSYSQKKPTYNLPRADPDLDGPAGCCQTWMQLGGVWASDPNYGPHIMGQYVAMLEWLAARRAAPPTA